MTQVELAKELGSSKSTISGYELGDTFPCIETIIKLSRLADVSCGWILKGDDDDERGGTGGDALTPEEIILLESFRSLSRVDQAAVSRIVIGLGNARIKNGQE